jgi:ABC-type oligopeptide transport system substrate-binding subunit
VRAGAALGMIALAALLLVACGEKAKQPKVDAATEQKEAHDRAVKGPFGGDVQAIDKAKALGGQMNQMATDNLEKADPK